MNLEWVKQKETEEQTLIAQKKQFVLDGINASDKLDDEQKKILCEEVESYESQVYRVSINTFLLVMLKLSIKIDFFEKRDFIKKIQLDEYLTALRCRGFNQYLDSEPVFFDGDIIITDPCYIIRSRNQNNRPDWDDYMKDNPEDDDAYARYQEAKDKWEEENPDDWDICNCGSSMDKLGLKTWMTRNTIYGDWSCTTYNSDTKEKIGQFCADAGLVSVFLLDEVLAYNPEFDYHTERPCTTTLIKNFKGTVQFVVEEVEGTYENDTEWWKAGDTWTEYEVHVVGSGINKVTGEPLNFKTSQTGL